MAPIALLLGIVLALAFGNPWRAQTKKLVTPLLQGSVIGLGAGMNLYAVLAAGASGFAYTVVGIALTIILGDVVLKRFFKSNSDTSFLITVGTAICGGSAIAAVSGAIRAKDEDISIALAVIFILNSVALLIFPPIGHAMTLTETQFGLWSALAIHDTSSVVGASMQFGQRALETATTVKLARAVWIVPLTIIAAQGLIGPRKRGEGKSKTKKPWFILGFLAMAALVTFVPAFKAPGQWIYQAAKYALVATLFLIGAGLTRETLRNVGMRPLLHGLTLWLLVSAATLLAIVAGIVSLRI